jgi:secretion/DNA translocation related TadE-like protein
VSRVRGCDRGAATVLVVALAAVMSVLCLATASLGAALLARHRAESAADLAALAAAVRVQQGAAGCPAAAAISRRNGGVLVRCTIEGAGATITVSVRRLRFVATATARAGPAD